MPDSVTLIDDDAFFDCSRLEKVKLGSKVERIGMYAFAFCDRLLSISFPASVKTVEMYAFAQCDALATISLGSVKTIGNYAFAFTDPAALSIPASCESIGVGAFHDCSELSKVTLREGLVRINRIAFAVWMYFDCIAVLPQNCAYIGSTGRYPNPYAPKIMI